MPRTRDGEWVSATEAARRIGVTAQALGHWVERAQKEGRGVVRLSGGRYEYQWPEFPRWREQCISMPGDFEAARTRKMAAEAEQAELELAKSRANLVPAETFDRVVTEIGSTLRSQLIAVPGRYAARTVGLKSLPESQAVWDGAMRDILAELQRGDRAR